MCANSLESGMIVKQPVKTFFFFKVRRIALRGVTMDEYYSGAGEWDGQEAHAVNTANTVYYYSL